MKLTIIGCGNMGSGLACRLAPHHNIYLFDRDIEKASRLEAEGYGIVCRELEAGFADSEIVILAIKPQNLEEVAKCISACKRIPPLMISILTGVTVAQLKALFPKQRIVRMMPNMAAKYGEGLVALALQEDLPDDEWKELMNLCNPLGKVYRINEDKINAFTAVAGSGPAFMLIMIEAMIEACIAMGFSSKDSQDFIHQMIKGTLHLWDKTGEHPGEIRWQIASPAGTTIAGIQKLEELGVRGHIIQTFLAAYYRANDMTKKN